MSPRRYDGWEPSVIHVKRTTEDGNEYVEVIREPEYNAQDRLEIEALLLCEELTCRGCGCWLPDSMHEDFAALVDESRCHGCQALAVTDRKIAEKHAQEKPTQGRPFWSDGARLTVRAATEAEIADRVRPA